MTIISAEQHMEGPSSKTDTGVCPGAESWLVALRNNYRGVDPGACLYVCLEHKIGITLKFLTEF